MTTTVVFIHKKVRYNIGASVSWNTSIPILFWYKRVVSTYHVDCEILLYICQFTLNLILTTCYVQYWQVVLLFCKPQNIRDMLWMICQSQKHALPCLFSTRQFWITRISEQLASTLLGVLLIGLYLIYSLKCFVQ